MTEPNETTNNTPEADDQAADFEPGQVDIGTVETLHANPDADDPTPDEVTDPADPSYVSPAPGVGPLL